jgi:hypothetical protein
MLTRGEKFLIIIHGKVASYELFADFHWKKIEKLNYVNYICSIKSMVYPGGVSTVGVQGVGRGLRTPPSGV